MANEDGGMEPCFGYLAYVNEKEKQPQPISITKRKFVIGRAKDCDLSLNYQLMSGHHCYLEALQNGQVYLYDTSSNGTLLNKTRLTYGQKQLLNTGDEFHLVFKKELKAVGFIFSASTACNQKEEDEGDGSALNDTEEYTFELPAQAGKSVQEPNTKENDEIEDHLICSICQEILYKPISLQPCMHCFCAGCYSDWMILSQECPQCRLNVKRVGPNHIVSNLVEAYLKLHPEKQRDADDIRDLEAKNRITHDMLYSKKLFRKHSSGSEPSGDSSSSEDSYSFVTGDRLKRPFIPYQKVCRQCPDNPDVPHAKQQKKENGDDIPRADMASCSQPSTSTKSRETTYACQKTTRHVHCSCCFEYMPDRSSDRKLDPSIPPQNCDLCPAPAFHYCSMYWGCKAALCTGCLAPLRNIVFAENCLDNIIHGNTYESNVLKAYLKIRKMGWQELFTQCIAKLEAGAYAISMGVFGQLPFDQLRRPIVVTSQTPVCKFCAYKCFGQLAYKFRAEISREDLEDEVTRREDCYWGQNCRSQTKYHHAKNFNHICEQTRFK